MPGQALGRTEGKAGMKTEEIIEAIKKLCGKHGVCRAVLFGSRAKGTFTERSDFDIAVTGAVDFELLKEEIEALPTLYTIDLVNLDTCGNDLLKEDIERYGWEIYKAV